MRRPSAMGDFPSGRQLDGVAQCALSLASVESRPVGAMVRLQVLNPRASATDRMKRMQKATTTRQPAAPAPRSPRGVAKAQSAPPLTDLDPIDEKIIAAMRRDGRVSNRELAQLINVNEGTVRARLRRLEETNTMRVVAIRDLSAMGFEHLCAVGVQVKGRRVTEVAADLAAVPQVLTVNVTLGGHDLEIQLVAHDIDEMGHLLTEVLSRVPGVARLTPSLALKVLKYESQWAPLS
jgi:Lrp/AsnC family transcriptional regulator for asnA, asnC and gidA